jgi:hypothetical protein
MIQIFHSDADTAPAAVVHDEPTAEAVVNCLRRHRRGKGSTPRAFAQRADGKRYTFPKDGHDDWRR